VALLVYSNSPNYTKGSNNCIDFSGLEFSLLTGSAWLPTLNKYMQLGNRFSPSDAPYSQNLEAFRYHSKRLQSLKERSIGSPSDPAVKKHIERGKLLARDRIAHLLDPGSAFLELSQLAATDLYDGVRPGAGLVTGVGVVEGTPCMIIANDATVKGGTYFPLTVKKHIRAQQIALENKLPCIYLVDSGGAFLPLQDQVFPDREHFGRLFYNQATMSALGIPQIAVVLGSCTAGGAYVPAMSDEAIIVKNQGMVFLGGPPLVKAATGEIVTAEELGGGDVHCRISGVTDHLASSDSDALHMARRSVASFRNRPVARLERGVSRPPRFNSSELAALIPSDPRQYFPMREIIARIVDDSELDEFKANYGSTLICGFAHIDGFMVGIIANDGILFSESALKAAHFIQLCDQRGIPLVFLQNIVGFMVGKDYEHKGIAKDGAKMVTAVACARVPKYTVIVGNSYGAGNYAMCGRAYDPRFLWSWPQSRIGVMGPDQAASVVTQVRADSAKSRGESWSEQAQQDYYNEIKQQYQAQTDSIFATSRLWDDGVIQPSETRATLSLALSLAPAISEPSARVFGTFRM
jgi:3-methylcrotonyl-CoA carboxylase beta subunit